MPDNTTQFFDTIGWKILHFFIITMFIIIGFSTLWSMMGLGALSAETTPESDLTLAHYDPITDINVTNETATISLQEDPRFETSGGKQGFEVTHVGLTRQDGKIVERKELPNNVQQLRWHLPDDIEGNYTITVYHYTPPNPGLFGNPEDWDSQELHFRVSDDGTYQITDYPPSTRFTDRDIGPIEALL